MICDMIDNEEEVRGRRYRYWLHRDLATDGNEGLVFVMLNPSTANAADDDPTVRRCMDFDTASLGVSRAHCGQSLRLAGHQRCRTAAPRL